MAYATAQGREHGLSPENVEGPTPESLLGGVLDVGFSGLMSAGRAMLDTARLKLADYACDRARVGELGAAADVFFDLDGASAAPRDELVAAAAASPHDGGAALRRILTHLLGVLTQGWVSEAWRQGFANWLYDVILGPALKNAAEVTQDTLCRALRGGDGAPELGSSADAEEPTGAPAPQAAEDVSPQAADGSVQAAIDALIDALETDPDSVEPKAMAKLRRAMGVDAGSRALKGDAAEVMRLMGDIQNLAEIHAKPDAKPVDLEGLVETVDALREALGDATLNIGWAEVEKTLKALKRLRMFDLLSSLADAFLTRAPQLFVQIAPHYAQGLIDGGKLVAAIEHLNEARAEANILGLSVEADPCMREIVGLIGRAHKQIYVNHVRNRDDARRAPEAIRESLRAAIKAYRDAEGARSALSAHWPMVNRVALLRLAERDAVVVEDDDTALSLAERVISELEPLLQSQPALIEDDPCVMASLGEAHLAVGAYDAAARCYAAYAKSGRIDRFQLAGSVRQLEEVWRLEAATTGAGAILANLKALLAPSGDIRLSPAERAALAPDAQGAMELQYEMQFETHIEGSDIVPAKVLKRLLLSCDAVCALKSADIRRATVGTGFLIDGPSLSPHLSADRSYVLTNAHVLWDKTLDPDVDQKAPLSPGNAVVHFEMAVKQDYRCARVIWQSPFSECDAALIELETRVAHTRPLTVSLERPRLDCPCAVIGHPLGGKLSVSLPGAIDKADAKVVDIGPRKPGDTPDYVHYEVSTERGNSGSPVLETQGWSVFALHHAGFGGKGIAQLNGKNGVNRANEGVAMWSIGEQVAAKLAGGAAQAQPPAAALAAEAADIDGEELDPEVMPEDFDPTAPNFPSFALPETDVALRYPLAKEGPQMRVRGTYRHRYPIGAIVHFTAGHFDKGDASAVGVMRYGAKHGHNYFCISTTGTVYQPCDLDSWGSHAGRSYYPGIGSWVSKYLVGIEICNAGLLSEKDGVYYPWWNAKHDPHGAVIPPDQIRRVAKKGNVTQAGPYHMYTMAQQEALMALLVWLHKNNPQVFRIENILGHDEVAVDEAGRLGRKQDPGGSLSMSMAELRTAVRARAADGWSV